jgi:predicted nucleotide-binding protein
LFLFLRAIGLKPTEWSEWVHSTGQGSPYVGEVLRIGFQEAQAFVVLMTPDDEARLREPLRGQLEETYEQELTPQPRPNVIFEAGMAMGIAPKRTIIVQLGKLRPMSDILGRHLVNLDNSTEKRKDFAQRLESVGCPVNWKGDDWLNDGDFDAALVGL